MLRHHHVKPGIEMAAHDDAQARAGGASGLLGELQGHAVEDNDVVSDHAALFFFTEERVEVDPAEVNEGAARLGGRAAERRVVVQDEPLAQLGVGGLEGRAARQAELVDEADPGACD